MKEFKEVLSVLQEHKQTLENMKKSAEERLKVWEAKAIPGVKNVSGGYPDMIRQEKLLIQKHDKSLITFERAIKILSR